MTGKHARGLTRDYASSGLGERGGQFPCFLQESPIGIRHEPRLLTSSFSPLASSFVPCSISSALICIIRLFRQERAGYSHKHPKGGIPGGHSPRQLVPRFLPGSVRRFVTRILPGLYTRLSTRFVSRFSGQIYPGFSPGFYSEMVRRFSPRFSPRFYHRIYPRFSPRLYR